MVVAKKIRLPLIFLMLYNFSHGPLWICHPAVNEIGTPIAGQTAAQNGSTDCRLGTAIYRVNIGRQQCPEWTEECFMQWQPMSANCCHARHSKKTLSFLQQNKRPVQPVVCNNNPVESNQWMASFCSNEPRSRPGRPSKRRDDSLEKFGNPGFHVSWASPARDQPEWSLLEHAQLHVTLYPAWVPIGSRRPGWAKKIKEGGNATGVPRVHEIFFGNRNKQG